MKNLLLAFVLSFLGVSVFAADSAHCGTKTGRQQALCYTKAINGERAEMRVNVEAIRKATHGREHLTEFNTNQNDWQVQINNACADRRACVYQSHASRNRWLKQQRKLLGV